MKNCMVNSPIAVLRIVPIESISQFFSIFTKYFGLIGFNYYIISMYMKHYILVLALVHSFAKVNINEKRSGSITTVT